MNWQEEGFLQKMRGKIRSMWGDLTDDDFERGKGGFDQLVGVIKEKTGEAEETIRERLNRMEREERETPSRTT